MKNQLFSLVMMFALVIVASTAMAQSTYTNAFVGSNHNYSVGGLSTGDGYDFYITQSTVIEDPAANTNTGGTIISGGSGTTAGASVSANITWNTVGVYNVWIRVQDNPTTGCYNYRYQTVTVTAYPVQFNILALMSGDEHTTSANIVGATGNASITDCPKFVDEQFNANNSPTEGNTYAYYKVTRSLPSGTTSNSNWTFTLSTATTATILAWEYSYDASAWSSITIGSAFTVDNSSTKHDIVYIRAKVQNVTEAIQTVDLNIGTTTPVASTAFEVTGNIKDNTIGTGDDRSTLNLSLIPKIGGFSGN